MSEDESCMGLSDQLECIELGRHYNMKEEYRSRPREKRVDAAFETAKDWVSTLSNSRKTLEEFIKSSETALEKINPSQRYCMQQFIISKVLQDIKLDLRSMSELPWLDVKIAIIDHLDMHDSETEARKTLFSMERGVNESAFRFKLNLQRNRDRYVEIMRRNRRTEEYVKHREFIANEHIRDLFIEELSHPYNAFLIGEEPETFEEAVGIFEAYMREFKYYEDKVAPEENNGLYPQLPVGTKSSIPRVEPWNPVSKKTRCNLCKLRGHQAPAPGTNKETATNASVVAAAAGSSDGAAAAKQPKKKAENKATTPADLMETGTQTEMIQSLKKKTPGSRRYKKQVNKEFGYVAQVAEKSPGTAGQRVTEKKKKDKVAPEDPAKKTDKGATEAPGKKKKKETKATVDTATSSKAKDETKGPSIPAADPVQKKKTEVQEVSKAIEPQVEATNANSKKKKQRSQRGANIEVGFNIGCNRTFGSHREF